MQKASITINGWVAPLLGLIFITLKLSGVITWSWWWVLSPFWIPVALIIVLLLIGFILSAIASKRV